MDYTVLARRFRPQSFGEVVGQETIAQALRNAIAGERVAHAYLFTGARGVGKTSTARILAKSLNCPQARAGDPCNQCDICHAISAGADVDVIEIDGASNRGIDEIRDLRANVNIKPMRSRYKIYIIDEVHMLTTPAFNALLKTLEEPPPNVKFIFCTTDPQKVPETILSRCQRFDFGTIATGRIRDRLAEIAAAEGVEVAPAALELVARRAAGSMRDSQSLFDQLLAFGGKQIGVEAVHHLLGTAPDDWLILLASTLAARDRAAVLEQLRQALDQGAQLGELSDQIVMLLRDLMVLCAGGATAPLLSVAEEAREPLARVARNWGLSTVLAALQIMADAKGRMKGVTYGRVLIEMALVRMASLDDLDRVADLMEWLKPAKPGPGATIPAPTVRRALPAAKGEREPASASPDRNSTRPDEPERSEVPESASPTPIATSPAATAATVPTKSTITFEPGNESAIWTEVLALLTGMTRDHASKAESTAISGPNQLVVTFPKSYDLSRKHFERSQEQLRPIQEALERVTGKSVRIMLALAPQPLASADDAPSGPARTATDRQAPDAGIDPLVQRALAAFDAKIVRVETSAGPRPSP